MLVVCAVAVVVISRGALTGKRHIPWFGLVFPPASFDEYGGQETVLQKDRPKRMTRICTVNTILLLG